MKIAFLPLYEIDKPSSRYRVFQFLPALDNHGFQNTILPAPQRNFIKRLLYVPRLLSIAYTNDILFIQKRMLPMWLLFLLKKLNTDIIFDIDDAVYLRPSQHEKTNRMLHAAKCVVVGNTYLAAYARNFNEHIVEIPTVVDTTIYQIPPEPRHDGDNRIIIGWIGSNPNRGDLTPLKPVFDWLSQRYKNRITLRIISDNPLQMKTDLMIEFVPWTLNNSLTDLQQFDIGIMPLDDTVWNQGKCGFKLIEYMAVGAATVASPIGVNQQIIEDGRTGYLATTIEEWQTRLAYLIEHDSARIAMGKLAAKQIEERYSITAVLPDLINTIQQTMDLRKI